MNFNNKLVETNIIVMSAHPDAILFEVHGEMTNNGEVSNIEMIYSLPYRNKVHGSLLVNLSDGDEEPLMEIIDQPWLEDRAITPYVSSTLTDALERVRQEGYEVTSSYVTLRHPLAPGFNTPLYIFGDNKSGFISVNVITGEVNKMK